jgi:hypothetical protein
MAIPVWQKQSPNGVEPNYQRWHLLRDDGLALAIERKIGTEIFALYWHQAHATYLPEGIIPDAPIGLFDSLSAAQASALWNDQKLNDAQARYFLALRAAQSKARTSAAGQPPSENGQI